MSYIHLVPFCPISSCYIYLTYGPLEVIFTLMPCHIKSKKAISECYIRQGFGQNGEWGLCLIFYSSLLFVFSDFLVRENIWSQRIHSPAWAPLGLQLFPFILQKEMLRLCAERFCNCIFLQQQQQLPFLQCTWSFILSFGMWVMTETYWFTNANTQGDHRGIEFTCQSV